MIRTFLVALVLACALSSNAFAAEAVTAVVVPWGEYIVSGGQLSPRSCCPSSSAS